MNDNSMSKCFTDTHSRHNSMSLISHLTSSFLAASNQNRNKSLNNNTGCIKTNLAIKRTSLTRNSSVNDDNLISCRNSTSSSSSLASYNRNRNSANFAENDSVFEESSISSSQTTNELNIKQNRHYDEDDDILVDDIDNDDLILNSNHLYNNNKTTDDFTVCNLSKMKLKQENFEFLNLIKKCQIWIETITSKKFAYSNDFRKSLENGVLLCELLNVLKKDCVRRINRHSTPIAGIDNLNVFLKACQENFHLAQSNLFDIIDLEDLNKRRGNNTTTNNNINNKDSNDELITTTTTTNHSNNQSKEIDSNTTNENFLDEEQQRRLKKVVNTIYWLSRKAIELGIPLAYHFDINNLNINNSNHITNNNNNKANFSTQNNHCLTNNHKNNNTKANSSFYYSSTSNLSLNQYSSSTSSSLSSSSSFIASISSSSSTSSTSSSLSTTNNPLSVIISTPLGPSIKPGPKSSFITNISAPTPQLLLKKKYNPNSSHKPNEIDSYDVNNKQENLNTMSYIYKPQPQLVTKLNDTNKLITRRSSHQIESSINRKDSIDGIDSFMKVNLKSNENNYNTSSPSVSSSSPGSTNHNQHTNESDLNNKVDNYLADSQDDLQLIDSTMSPISSSTNSAISPHLISTSSSTNLSNSTHNLNGSTNHNNKENSSGKSSNINNNNIQIIPTRFVDRRVSTCVNQTYKFNYSEAGQRLARKAQEQLKTVEKSKDTDTNLAETVLSSSLSSNKLNNDSNTNGLITDDWQNSVDDWKKRRREKVKMPPPRNTNNGEYLNDDEQISQQTRTDRKRINKFENSNYYLQPYDDENNPIEIKTDLPNNNHQNDIKEIDTTNIKSQQAATIEISGVRNYNSTKMPIKNTKQQENNQIQLNDSIQNSTHDDASNENENLLINLTNYKYVERVVDLVRTDDYNLRGFGFLLKSGSSKLVNNSQLNSQISYVMSQNYAEIVGLDPHSLADKACLKKGDLVSKINEFSTSNLNSEQLRKIMTDRLKLSSIQLTVLSLENEDINKIDEEKDDKIKEESIEPATTIITKKEVNQEAEKPIQTTTPSFLLNKSHTINLQQDYQQIVAPKPFRKSLPSSNSTSTLTTSSNQLSSIEMNTSNSLFEKQKTQLNLILNWTLQQQQQQQQHELHIDYLDNRTNSPDLSAFDSDSSSSISLLDACQTRRISNNINNNHNKSISLSPSLSVEFLNNSTHFDSLNDIIINKNLFQSNPSATQNTTNEKLVKQLSNDDTDHDNDDVDSDEFQLSPPPIPATDPPPLPCSSKKQHLSQEVPTQVVQPADLIKKELKDNIKSVENWKIEQEILMKRKYQEEQKRIEVALKIDLEKVKEEENQRREQERLKLEKERLRLQELELKEREHEILNTHLESTTATSKHLDNEKPKDAIPSPAKSNETVRKEDLNALIEKIYTEQEDEENFLIEYTQPPTANPPKLNLDPASPTKSALKQTNNSNNKTSVVMTKTSPIVAAALSCDEDKEIFTDLIDTTTKHQIIKQVHDSMDNLKNQLLHKGMTKYADDVDAMNKNLEYTRKKQEELERIKREQEQIKIEKERIEHEKEKLRQEAEQLRKEREMILMAATSKAAAITATTPTSSSSSSSTTMNEPLESEYSQTLQSDLFTKPHYDASISQLTMSLSSSSLSPARKVTDSPNSKILTNPQSWLIEEVERKRLLQNQQQQQHSVHLNQTQLLDQQQQRLRRSFPNLLIDSNSNSLEPKYTTNSQINFINTPFSTASGLTKIYTKKKSSNQQQQSNGRPVKLQSSSTSRNNLNYFTSAKPPQPQPSNRLISTSSNDFKNIVKHKSNSSTHLNSLMPPPPLPQVPVISLNQKCSNCNQALGQGSAMFIEKLSLAFHLKCFRCSVCNIPLGNGKEGTDVRVSITNRLHCNNCFSNDLGVRLSAV